jgi:hypothetical protein
VGSSEHSPNDDSVLTLETEVADLGVLLLDLARYRSDLAPTFDELRQAALRLGDRARRAHHTGHLDTDTAPALLLEASDLGARLRAALATVRSCAPYREAVAAHARGDFTALARLLPTLFVAIEPITDPPTLYWAVPWRRRNRPLPPTDIARDLAEIATTGLPTDGDLFTPGADPALPAVSLLSSPPPGEPIVLELDADTLPRPLCRVVDSGDVLAPCVRLRVPFVALLRATLEADEIEATPVDYPAFRQQLAAALTGARLRWRPF